MTAYQETALDQTSGLVRIHFINTI
jgi:hypothetical protein